MNNWPSLVALLVTLFLPSLAEASETEKTSPQYIYMERLREVTHDMGFVGTTRENRETSSEGSTQNPGTLLATSFKDTCKFLCKIICAAYSVS